MVKWRVGYRTLKTAIGAALAIFIAQLLGLEFFVSAGIITVLCISVTKKESLRASWERIVACLIGLVFASVLFAGLGYHPLTIALLFALFIPTAVSFGLERGIVTSVVTMLHLYIYGSITTALWINELLLITIGVTVALVMNSYMPSLEKTLVGKQAELEDRMKQIWKEYSLYLREGESAWDGKEITQASAIVNTAKGMALKTMDNYFLRNEDYFYHYFRMREKQLDVIERILPFISTLDRTVVQGEKMAEFMDELSDAISPNNKTEYFLNKLSDLSGEIRNMALPGTREEFEVRSALFYILHELENYLTLKKMFKPDPKRTDRVLRKRLHKESQ
ncbi:aromatic acid exporter family protein [Bacillus piscicola]|uniref:aromatic acid exporter family protein n=1 Tax=Bacillus piscicola TaxID=1632684 RepID=UPI001F09253A|nr:aromatic acid exporter family protein [Bacillus piscicola]